MGGFGSGRKPQGRHRGFAERACSIDIRDFARVGTLRAGNAGHWQWAIGTQFHGRVQVKTAPSTLLFTYRLAGDARDAPTRAVDVAITQSACHLGGSRAWFVCPGAGCGSRVAILYFSHSVACRRCHDLAYISSRESCGMRAIRRADRLRARLGWKPGVANGIGAKPKHMHWKTYARAVEQHRAWVQLSLTETECALWPKRSYWDA